MTYLYVSEELIRRRANQAAVSQTICKLMDFDTDDEKFGTKLTNPVEEKK
jgi:hypothetical protein